MSGLPELSKRALMKLMEQRYIEAGYSTSGSAPMNAEFFRTDGNRKRMQELLSEGKLVRRDCKAECVELPVQKKYELIKRFKLAEKWEKGVGRVFYPNSSWGEVSCTMVEYRKLKRRREREQTPRPAK